MPNREQRQAEKIEDIKAELAVVLPLTALRQFSIAVLKERNGLTRVVVRRILEAVSREGEGGHVSPS